MVLGLGRNDKVLGFTRVVMFGRVYDYQVLGPVGLLIEGFGVGLKSRRKAAGMQTSASDRHTRNNVSISS